jgi:uncharacterized protein with ParB-like and HNH nuclease domain
MDNFNNDRTVNVEILLSQFYKVADFQRDYVWEEEDIEQLANDIIESMKENQEKYFLGAIVLTDGEGKYLIVDGQQRITTLTIFIAALKFKLKNSDIGLSSYLNKFIVDQKLTKGVIEISPRLLFDEISADNAIKKIFEGDLLSDIDIDSDTDTAKNIKAGFSYLINYLGMPNLDLSKLADYLLNKVVLLPYITNNMKQALTVFETLNSKGRSLTPIDLLKNALFSHEPESNWESLKEQWVKFKTTLDGVRESEKRFLKYYILVNHSQRVAEGEVFDWITNPRNTTMSDSPFRFLEHIQNFAESYSYVINNKAPDGTENKKIQNIRYLAEKGRQFFPLLISLKKLNSSSDSYEKILNSIESLLFSYSIMRAYTGAIESTFSEWTRKLNNAQSEDEINKFIDKDVVPEVKRMGRQAYEKLCVLTEKDIARKKLQFLLVRIDIELNVIAGSAYKAITEYSNYEIEHIIPKKYDSEIINGLTPELHAEIIFKLGNLTILEKPLNRSIKNSSISEKKRTYENSAYLLCKASVQNIRGQNTLAKANALVHKIGPMDLEDVTNRQKNLANIYSIIYGWGIEVTG